MMLLEYTTMHFVPVARFTDIHIIHTLYIHKSVHVVWLQSAA